MMEAFGTKITGEVVVINKPPKTAKDTQLGKQYFSVKGTFASKEPTFAGYEERVIIEGEYDFKEFQHLQPGCAIKVSGWYTRPLMHDGYGLLVVEDIRPCALPEPSIEDDFNNRVDNPYMHWRNQNILNWMQINDVINQYLCRYPQHFELEQGSQGEPWLQLSALIRELNRPEDDLLGQRFVAPQGLVDSCIGQTVREHFFDFVKSLGKDLVTARAKPDLRSVDPEP
jgi:hypothetical protein